MSALLNKRTDWPELARQANYPTAALAKLSGVSVRQLERDFLRKFGEPQIKIVWFEEYVAQTTAVVQDDCQFLEISGKWFPGFNRLSINGRGPAPQRMARIGRSHIQVDTTWDEETRQWVLNQVRDDNCNFLSEMGRRKDYWGDLF